MLIFTNLNILNKLLDVRGNFSLSKGNGFRKNVIILVPGISSSVYVDSREEDVLILGKDPS